MAQIGTDSVGRIGFGAMGLSAFYGYRKSEEESLKVVKRAVELGATMIDTADIYGMPTEGGMGQNERLLSNLLQDASFRKQVFIATKFGNYAGPDGKREIRGKPDYVRSALEKSLADLKVDSVDLYYQHRVDRTIPIEDTFKELAALQKEGKIKHIGMSEATSEEIRKASAVAKIAALQIEFSPWTPQIRTNGILDTCRELGIKIVAYSPLGRGFLTGKYKSVEDFEEGDFRRNNPRFQGDAFAENLKLVEKLQQIAEKKGCTASQLCLAWVLAQGDDFIPIPGTTSVKNLEDNMVALNIKLSKEELSQIDSAIQSIEIKGERYQEGLNKAGAF